MLAACRQAAFDKKTILLIFAAALLYYFHFYRSDFVVFTADFWGHAHYVQYIAERHAIPSPDYSLAALHPPAYYLMAAGLYELATHSDAVSPFLVVRHLSMALYLAFIFISTLALRRLLPKTDTAYYAALSLLLFWPLGVVTSARIGPDLLLYVGQAGVIYALIGWLQERRTGWLAAAFAFAGIALLAKMIGIVFLALAGTFLLYVAYTYRRKLIDLRLLAALAFALAAAYLILTRHSIGEYTAPGTQIAYSLGELAHRFLWFDPVLFLDETIINQHHGESQIRFWHWFLRSMLLGDYVEWKALAVVFAFGVVWLLMIIYAFLGLLLAKPTRQEKILLGFMTGVAAMLVGMLMANCYLRPDEPGYADARYIYPIVMIFSGLFGLAMEWHARAGREVWLRVGRGISLGFVLLTLVLFLAQHIFLTRVQ